MAVMVDEGFSIREYVLRMRSVNLVKSWPFEGPHDEECVKSFLPLITVKKFIWWADGFDFISSQNVENPVEKIVEMGGLRLKSRRRKPKFLKKKRSILEIFAVASSVERITSGQGKKKTKKKPHKGDLQKQDEVEAVGNRKKKPGLEQANDLVNPKHSILKNEAKKVSHTKQRNRNPDKHVTFLQKDNNPGRKRTPTQHEEDLRTVGSITSIEQNQELDRENRDFFDLNLGLRQCTIDKSNEVLMDSSGSNNAGSLAVEDTGAPDIRFQRHNLHQTRCFYGGSNESTVTLPLNSLGKFIQNCPLNEKNLPTLRLMGKEFIVGDSFKEAVDEFRIEPRNEMASYPDHTTRLMMHNLRNGLKQRDDESVEKTCPSSFSEAAYSRNQFFWDTFRRENQYQFHQEPQAPRSSFRFPFMHPYLDQHAPASTHLQGSQNGILIGDLQSGVHGSCRVIGWPASIAPMICYPGMIIPVSSVERNRGNQKVFNQRNASKAALRGHCASPRSFEDDRSTVPAMKRSRMLIPRENIDDERVDRVHPWSGPLKLTAEAKYILKGPQQMDHSTSLDHPPLCYDYMFSDFQKQKFQ